VRVMPSLSAGSPLLAPLPLLVAVYARQQHQDRNDPDDKKHKHQSNRFLAAHTAILCPEGINEAGQRYGIRLRPRREGLRWCANR
jgi:hypothetical protein